MSLVILKKMPKITLKYSKVIPNYQIWGNNDKGIIGCLLKQGNAEVQVPQKLKRPGAIFAFTASFPEP